MVFPQLFKQLQISYRFEHSSIHNVESEPDGTHKQTSEEQSTSHNIINEAKPKLKGLAPCQLCAIPLLQYWVPLDVLFFSFTSFSDVDLQLNNTEQ